MFDIIVGNPPYQELKPGNKKSQAIWPKFVEKGLSLCKGGGFFSMIHPSGWRDLEGRFKKVQEALLGRRMLTLNMNDIQQGIETFGATTAYDFYTVQNIPADGHPTIISGTAGTALRCLDELDFVPSGRWDEIASLLAKDGEETVKIDSSPRYAYSTMKEHVSKQQDNVYRHPCAANIGRANNITKTYWSNTNKLGHFGVAKVIFGRLSSGMYVDVAGEYGMCQDCFGIVDSPENLENIKKAMQSEAFRAIMTACKVGGLAGEVYNRKIIALFRKDFWQEFV